MLKGSHWEGTQARIIALAMMVITSGMVVHILIKLFGEVPGIGAIWYVPSAIAIWLLATQSRDLPALVIRSGLVVALPLVCLASTLWSKEPADTFASSLRLLSTAVVAIYLAARLDWQDLMRVIFVMLLVAIGLSTLLALVLPTVGRMPLGEYAGAWSGVYAEKQFLGINAAFAIIIAGTMTLIDRRYGPYALGLVLLSFLCLAMARSVTSLLVCAVGCSAFVFVALLRSGSRAAVWAVFALMATLATAYFTITLAQEELLAAFGRDSTLTSRTSIWESVNEMIKMRPILGWGYDAVWTQNQEESSLVFQRLGWLPFHAHSTWLDARLQLGWLGLGLTIAIMAICILRSIAATPRIKAAYWCVPFLAMILSMSFSETLFFYPNDFNSFMLLLIFCKLPMDAHARRYRTNASSTGEIQASRF
jgi:O-antigen ligase